MKRHPLHPAMVHLPIAAFVLSPLADLASLFWPGDFFEDSAFLLLAVGLVSGGLAFATGALDLRRVRGNQAERVASLHMLVMFVVLSLALASLLLRRDSVTWPPARTLATGLGPVMVLLLVWGAWLGGRLVYEFRTGVVGQTNAPEETPDA